MTDNPYGFCPVCRAPGVERERRLGGNDRCANGCMYPSRSAVYLEPSPAVIMDNELVEIRARHDRHAALGPALRMTRVILAQAVDDRGRLLDEVRRLRKGRDWAMNKIGDDALERGKAL